MGIGLVSLSVILLGGQTNDVSFRNVALTYNVSLAPRVVATEVPSEPIEGPGWEGPTHLAFAFHDSYAVRHTPAPYLDVPEIRIYRVADFEKALPQTRKTIRKLQSLLASKRADRWNGEMPVLPPYNAMELFHCRLKALHSSSMAGVRFLAAYAQDAREISNDRLEFVFSGLSNDGKYYLVSHFPVFVSKIESDQWVNEYDRILRNDLTEDSPEYRRYIKSVITSLETPEEDHFDPVLRLLDDLLQSVDLTHIRF